MKAATCRGVAVSDNRTVPEFAAKSAAPPFSVVTPEPEPLGPGDANRLVEFARACKAAARAVTLYPLGHPAIATTLGRIVSLTAPDQLASPLRLSVHTDSVLLDDRALPRPEGAVGELAALLHGHLIGELIVRPGGDLESWRTFLLLLARPTDEVRAEGGIAALWAAANGQHVEVREIDYAHVLRERNGSQSAAWQQIIACCLQGEPLPSGPAGDAILSALVEAASSEASFQELMAAVQAQAGEGDHVDIRVAAILRLLQNVVDAIRKTDTGRLDPAMNTMAAALGQLSPEVLSSLLAAKRADGTEAQRLVGAIAERMTDNTISGFVANNAFGSDSSLERVAQAFQTLVRDADHAERLLAMAHDTAQKGPEGAAPGFEETWDQVAEKVMKSYSDKPWVSESYARELTAARTQAVEVEQTNDDPPERVAAWLATVATSELRKLDLSLVLDLLRIEEDGARWADLMRPVVSLVEDLVLVGDVDAAADLVAIVEMETGATTMPARKQAAEHALTTLAAGSLLAHLVPHLATLDTTQFERIKVMSRSLGDGLVRHISDALTNEERAAVRDRLAAMLFTFGAAGRKEAERLKSSPNAAVRRTAVHLLREFGGSDALPELTQLLNDPDVQVQREAVRAILNIGSEQACRVLERAIVGGTPAARESIMQALSGRGERAVPVFASILERVDHKGELGALYVRAIEGLGALKDASGVPALKHALYRGEWWAPRRTATLRSAAAGALIRIGTPEALGTLNEAVRSGGRGVRAAAQAALGSRGRSAA